MTASAGGDWFDAIPLTGGSVALVVGDVVGHGLAASAAMGQLRAVLAELLVAESDLECVLARTDAFATRTPAFAAGPCPGGRPGATGAELAQAGSYPLQAGARGGAEHGQREQHDGVDHQAGDDVTAERIAEEITVA